MSGHDNAAFSSDTLPHVEVPARTDTAEGSGASSLSPEPESPTTSQGKGELSPNGDLVKKKLSDPEVDSGMMVHAKGQEAGVVILEVGDNEPQSRALRPYAGMGKEDLLRFSNTPFWNRFRLACTIIFWIAWFGLVGAVIGLTIAYPRCSPPPVQEWWRTSIYYQVYVRSFYDSDGDGVGDINGIREKLDYLSDLKTDTIILSSFYQSQIGTNPDYGYEVVDHKAIDPTYGTMSDLEELLAEAHGMGMRVVLDFIPNHTGTDHPWFTSSRTSLPNDPSSHPYWNYYIWAQCANNTVPNNWQSVYGSGSAWSRDVTREECYLHQFLHTQAELNLRSTLVQQELEDILRFWLDKGVDGFRVNNAKYLFESADLLDESSIPGCTPAESYSCLVHNHTTSQPEVYDIIGRWRAAIDEYTQRTGEPRALITDAVETINATMSYFGRYGPDGANLPINYQLSKVSPQCDGDCLYELVDDWLYNVPDYGTSNWLTGTQDMSRILNKLPVSNPTATIREDPGWVNAMTLLKLTLPGPPMMYYGEEIGMTNGQWSGTGTVHDPVGLINASMSRDRFRTPMQWLDDEYGGFLNVSMHGEPENGTWLPVNADTNYTSVEAQYDTPGTPLFLFRELTKLRNDTQTLIVGHFHYSVLTDHVFSYIREYEGHPWYLIAVNFGTLTEDINFFNSHYMVPETADVTMTTRTVNMSVAVGDSINMNVVTMHPGDGIMFTWPYERPERALNG